MLIILDESELFLSEEKGEISSHWARKTFLKRVKFLPHLTNTSYTNSLGPRKIWKIWQSNDLIGMATLWIEQKGHVNHWTDLDKLLWIWRLDRYEELLKNLKFGQHSLWWGKHTGGLKKRMTNLGCTYVPL